MKDIIHFCKVHKKWWAHIDCSAGSTRKCNERDGVCPNCNGTVFSEKWDYVDDFADWVRDVRNGTI